VNLIKFIFFILIFCITSLLSIVWFQARGIKMRVNIFFLFNWQWGELVEDCERRIWVCWVIFFLDEQVCWVIYFYLLLFFGAEKNERKLMKLEKKNKIEILTFWLFGRRQMSKNEKLNFIIPNLVEKESCMCSK
jgi:hypothetical protein